MLSIPHDFTGEIRLEETSENAGRGFFNSFFIRKGIDLRNVYVVALNLTPAVDDNQFHLEIVTADEDLDFQEIINRETDYGAFFEANMDKFRRYSICIDVADIFEIFDRHFVIKTFRGMRYDCIGRFFNEGKIDIKAIENIDL